MFVFKNKSTEKQDVFRIFTLLVLDTAPALYFHNDTI